MSRRPCILILDDDTDIAESFGALLRDHGIDVRVTGDPDAGWAEVVRLPPDAILLDLRLGARDGTEFLRQLRASPLAGIPVAMITGDYLVDDRITEELCALSAQLHFKPLWDEDVVRIVKGLLARTRTDLAPRDSARTRQPLIALPSRGACSRPNT